jgi:tripartite-type tricarboxylate transporter receptor subunit TctC
MKKKVLALFLLLAVCGGFLTAEGQQEAFPSKKVTIIVPWGLGGGVDVIARKVASYGEKYLGQPVIVENHTGGAGTIAMTDAIKASDDGYTMIVANGPLFSLTPHFQKVTYKLEDITPLIGMRSVEFVCLSNPAVSGIDSMEALKEYSKDHVIKYATTGGPGNDGYTLLAVLFEKMGIEAKAVPFNGGLDAINALVGGHVDISIGSPPVYADYVKSGKLVSLGVFTPDSIKVEGLDVQPSFKSQGIDLEFTGLDYFAVRSSVAPEKQEVLAKFIKDVYADEEFIAFMNEMKMESYGIGAEELFAIIDAQSKDMTQYVDLIK